MQKNKVIFDIDGVLIDTSKSFRCAIKKTVEYFCGHIISLSSIDYLKHMPGFNNDWYCAYILTNVMLNDLDLYNYELVSPDNEKISYNKVKDVFQTYYLGSSRFDQAEFKFEPGLWETESCIFNIDELQNLKFKHGHLSIITGRTHEEADFVLNYFHIRKFFSEVISIESTENLRFDLYPQYKMFGQDKSNPIYLFSIPNIKECETIYYIGDNISDVKLVSNSREIFSIKSIFLLQTYGKREQAQLKKIAKNYKPDYIAYTKDEVIAILKDI